MDNRDGRADARMRFHRRWRWLVAGTVAAATAVAGRGVRPCAANPSDGATLANWGGATVGPGDAVPGSPASGTVPLVPLNEVPLGPGVVGIVAVPPGDPLLTETAARIQLELGATAIPSRFITCAHADAQETEACGSPARPPETAAAGGTASTEAASPLANETTVLSLSRRSRAVIIEAVANLANGTKVFRLVHVPVGKGGVDSTVLSIRAVELLRDVRLEVARDKRLPPPPAPPAVEAKVAAGEARGPLAAPPPVPPPAAVQREDPGSLVVTAEPNSAPPQIRWGVRAAVSSLLGSDSVGYAPLLSLQVFRGAHLSADLTAAGPYFQRVYARMVGGSIDTRQEFAVVGARWGWDLGWVRPYLGLAAGLYHLRLGYMPPDPPAGAAGLGESFWAPVVLPRAGFAIPVTAHVAVALEYGLLFTGPPVELVISSEVISRLGGPSALVQLAVVAMLP